MTGTPLSRSKGRHRGGGILWQPPAQLVSNIYRQNCTVYITVVGLLLSTRQILTRECISHRKTNASFDSINLKSLNQANAATRCRPRLGIPLNFSAHASWHCNRDANQGFPKPQNLGKSGHLPIPKTWV